MSDNQTYKHVRKLLIDDFDIQPDAIRPDARLYEDLGIDSIDAVDMIVQLQSITGERIPPDQFKAVRTMQDVVDTIESMNR